MILDAKRSGGCSSDGGNGRGKAVWNENNSNNRTTTAKRISAIGGGDSSTAAVADGDRRIKYGMQHSNDLSSSRGNAGGINPQQDGRSRFRSWPSIIKGRKRLENKGEMRNQSPQRSPRLLSKSHSATQVRRNSVPPIRSSIPETPQSSTANESSATFKRVQKFVPLAPASSREVNFEREWAWELQLSDGTLVKVFYWGFLLVDKYGVEHCPLGIKGQIGGWRLRLSDTKVIGRGASSTVYLGFDEAKDRKCAVKVINIMGGNRQQQIAQEIVTFTHCLAYPNESLLNFLGVHRGSESQVHIIFDYMDCGSLKNHIQYLKAKLANSMRVNPPPLSHYSSAFSVQKAEHTFPERVLVAIGWQILQGLKHLHSLKLLHCDIKPSNILLNQKGEAKLADLGIAAQLKKVGGVTNGTIGTTQYMSPERLEGMSYGWQADIWSFGLILLECASLCCPWDSCMGEVEQLQIIAEVGSRGLVRAYGQHLSSAFQDFVASCMHVKPGLRSTVDELLGARWFSLHGVSSRDSALVVMEDYLSKHASDIPNILACVNDGME